MSRLIKASEFKAKCLSLVAEVERTGETLVITKKRQAGGRAGSAQEAEEEPVGNLEG